MILNDQLRVSKVMVKSATQGQGTTQGIEIGEKLLWKYEEKTPNQILPLIW